MFRRLENCYNIDDLRSLAKAKLPGPVFHYIDGAADDEITYRRNTEAFEQCDLVPNVLTGVDKVDMSVTVMGQKLDMPIFCSPTALQKLFHHDGERAVAQAAAKYGTMFGVSSLTTVPVDEIAALTSTPKLYQFYFFKDRGLNDAMLARAKEAKFDVLALTVDTITGGNRERDLRTGFTSPLKLTPEAMLSFALHPQWTLNYLTRGSVELEEMKHFMADDDTEPMSIGDVFTNMLDSSMDWSDAEELRAKWGGEFCLKGIMSVTDAIRAVNIGATSIMVSNHGGRQLDGSRSPFDQIAEITDAVGDRIDVILDGGVQRGTHVLKAMAAGAKACSGGRMYLYALAAAGQRGVEKALGNLKAEIERDMQLMGITDLSQLTRDMLRYR